MKALRISLFIFSITFLTISCEENETTQQVDIDFSNISFENFSFPMGPEKVSMKDYPLDQMFAEIATDLMADDINFSKKAKAANGEVLVGGDLLIHFDKEEVIITPVEELVAAGETEKLSREESEDWKSYVPCTNEDCVKETLEKVRVDHGKTTGDNCLELKVRLNQAKEVHIRARAVSC